MNAFTQAIHTRIDQPLTKRSAGTHTGAAGASLLALGLVNGILNALYAASNHPVPYAEGQTSFDADKVKGWYQAMTDAGSLDVYVYTQLFDYVFMMTFALFALTVASLLRRLNTPWNPGMTLARSGGLAVAIGMGFDAIENLLSFVMLANPTDFPDVLVLPYSGAAVIKFAFVSIGLVLLLVALATGLITRLRAR